MLLGACNVVVTKTPLFTAADEAGAPPLRPGVWLIFTDGDCKFDESRPLLQWPECAGGAIVKQGEIAGHDRKADKDVWEHDPFIFAAGDPRIAQILTTENISVDASATASGGATASASSSGGGQTQSYAYAAARPTKTDADGKITAITFWEVLCGPPPPKNKKGEDTAMGTMKPLPGMEMKPGDAMCTTTSTKALRGAARASEAWKEKALNAHWVRDGEK
ncbi:MAG: hypothetical protein ACHP7N_06370 [Caulobacterales bacterium]